MAEERSAIICLLVSSPGRRQPGSTITECMGCHELVDIAPPSVAYLKQRPDTEVFCVGCALEAAKGKLAAKPVSIPAPATVVPEKPD